jgi:hypothetical protein
MTDFYIYADGGSPGTKLSEVQRKYNHSTNKIVLEHRLSNGTLARKLVTTKNTFSFSWEYLPYDDSDVADDGMGVSSIEGILDGVIVLRVPEVDGTYTEYNTLLSPDSYQCTLALRRSSGKTYWNVSLTLQEV